MILTLDNLRAGLKWWLDSDFPADFNYGEYQGIYEIRADGITEDWWAATVECLGKWRAYRGPKEPNTKVAITKRGNDVLKEIAQHYDAIMEKADGEPSIAEMSWPDVEPLFETVLLIKPTSFVFASKLCHFIFPNLFIVMDNTLTEVFYYEFYWRGMHGEWGRFNERDEARQILIDSINTNINYPFETRIMELCHIGYKHKAESKSSFPH